MPYLISNRIFPLTPHGFIGPIADGEYATVLGYPIRRILVGVPRNSDLEIL